METRRVQISEVVATNLSRNGLRISFALSPTREGFLCMVVIRGLVVSSC